MILDLGPATEPHFRCGDFACSLSQMLSAYPHDEELLKWFSVAQIGDEYADGEQEFKRVA